MSKIDIELRCRKKADELLEKFFPGFIHEAAIDRPEQLAGGYNDKLPYAVEAEFRDWLSGVWKEVAPAGSEPFEKIMNRHLDMSMVDASYVPNLKEARADAEKISLWEKITKSNHEDVTYYKGLLKQYTEELLSTMIKDFIEEIPE